jgi:hypothetical protein
MHRLTPSISARYALRVTLVSTPAAQAQAFSALRPRFQFLPFWFVSSRASAQLIVRYSRLESPQKADKPPERVACVEGRSLLK